MPKTMTLTEFKTLSQGNGNHFFDRKTMQFFGSRVETWHKDGYFITSEKTGFGPETTRRFTIRKANLETGNVETVGEFNKIHSLEDAREALKEIKAITKG